MGRTPGFAANALFLAVTLTLAAGAGIAIAKAMPIGHKLARRPIAAGEKVTKYGAPIGTATRGIATGEHVHVHNLASDYTASISLEGATS